MPAKPAPILNALKWASTTVMVRPAHVGSSARSPNYEKFQDAPRCWCRTEHLKVVAVPMSGFAPGKNSSFGREMRSSTIRVNGCAFRLPKETAIPNYLLRSEERRVGKECN